MYPVRRQGSACAKGEGVTWSSTPQPSPRAVLKGGKKRKGFVTPTEGNVHGDTLCFMVMGPSLLLYFSTSLLLYFSILFAVGGWRRLAVGGPWRLSLRAVLNQNEKDLGS